jgi:hypothetical protein
MAKRKKRNAITLVSLLLALAALIGVYYWYSNKPASTENTEEATPTIALAKIDTTQISSLHYVKGDADLTLVLENNVWASKNEPGRPINQDYVKAILNAYNDINADRVINEKPENLADYGLAEPSASLEVTKSDGTVVSVKIGNVAGDSLGYYGLVNNDGIVYLLPIEMGTALQYTDAQMTAVIEAPEITAENIDYINIANRDGQNYELKLDDTGKLDNTGNNIYQWQILQPYGEGYTADTQKVSEIQSNYSSFKFIQCVDYSGQDLSKYGLDNPTATIDVGYFVPRTEPLPTPELGPTTGQQVTEKTIKDQFAYKIFVGNKDEAGDYYVQPDGTNAVYTIQASTIDKMLTMDNFSLMNKYILIPNIANVDQVSVDVNGTAYNMTIERTTQKNADGKDETVATYYFNGNKVDESAFKNLYTAMVSPQYDAEIQEDVKTDGVTPYLTMSFHIFGDNERTISASYLPYNDSFFIVKKADGTRFLVDKRKIEDLGKLISSFTGTSVE